MVETILNFEGLAHGDGAAQKLERCHAQSHVTSQKPTVLPSCGRKQQLGGRSQLRHEKHDTVQDRIYRASKDFIMGPDVKVCGPWRHQDSTENYFRLPSFYCLSFYLSMFCPKLMLELVSCELCNVSPRCEELVTDSESSSLLSQPFCALNSFEQCDKTKRARDTPELLDFTFS